MKINDCNYNFLVLIFLVEFDNLVVEVAPLLLGPFSNLVPIVDTPVDDNSNLSHKCCPQTWHGKDLQGVGDACQEHLHIIADKVEHYLKTKTNQATKNCIKSIKLS